MNINIFQSRDWVHTIDIISIRIAKPTRTVAVPGKPQVHAVVSLTVPAGRDVGIHVRAGNVRLEK
jgi:hypothetical protein